MSTRAVVKIINGRKSLELYHHCDGYPEGLGCFLLKEMKKVQDEENYNYKCPEIYLRKWINEFNFKITLYNHCDIEYYYEFDIKNKKVTCKSVNNWGSKMEVYESFDMEDFYKKNKDKDVLMYYEEE